MSKGFIERPAQHIVTAASGPLADWYCQTQSYLHFERCIWMTSIEPSRLWGTREGYREIPIQIRVVDVMGGGGGGAGPAPSIQHQEPGTQAGLCTMNIHNFDISTNISIAPYLVFGVCTLAVQWECMRTVCRRSRVRNPLAFFRTLISIGMNWNILVCTGMYQYVQV